MFTCHACGHDDGVHNMFVGCCGVIGCACEGMDGKELCRRDQHGEACGWATLRPPPGQVDDTVIRSVLDEHHNGVGIVKLHRKYDLEKRIVRAIIAGTISPSA